MLTRCVSFVVTMDKAMNPTGQDGPRSGALAGVIVAAVALIPTLALILTGCNAGRAAFDSVVYHERFIRELASDWPRFDVSNPLTATTPGYHILLATLAHFGVGSETLLRLASAVIGACFCGYLGAGLARRCSRMDAVLLALPLACSSYVINSGAWLLPDNLAWMGVLSILYLSLRETRSWRPVILGAVLLLALVLVRQVHVWAAALVWLTAWLGARPTDRTAFDHIPSRALRAGVAVLLTLPAFAVIVFFVKHWGGLTPPRFQSDISGVNPATPAFLLVQMALFSAVFSPWLLTPVYRTIRRSPRVVLLAAGVGFVLAAVPVTRHDPSIGNYTGFWILTKLTPSIAGRTSPAFLVLAPIGAVMFAGAICELPRRQALVFLGALAAFAAAQSSTLNSWQRYHEPMLLMLLALVSASQPAVPRPAILRHARPWMIAGLCLFFLSILYTGVRGEPVDPNTPPPAKHTSPGDPWYMAPAAQPVEAE